MRHANALVVLKATHTESEYIVYLSIDDAVPGWRDVHARYRELSCNQPIYGSYIMTDDLSIRAVMIKL